MPIVSAKCERCGAVFTVDSDVKADNCKHCGAAFVVQDAIDLFHNSSNGESIISATDNPVPRKRNANPLVIIIPVMIGILVLWSLAWGLGNFLKQRREIRTVQDGYLTAYSEDVTIGEALEDLLSDIKWTTKKGGRHYSYVICTGECEFVYANGEREPEEIEIWFRIYNDDNDKFKVDRIYSNGSELNDFEIIAFFEDVYGVEIDLFA